MGKRYGVLGWTVVAGMLWTAGPVGAAEDLTDLLVKKGTITKEEAASVQKRSISSAVDRISFYGDLQLREETQWFSGDDNDTRNVNRQRYRLRIGADLQEGGTIIHLRFAGGNGAQTTVNQTMGNLSSGKSIFIDRAYLEYVRIPNTTLQLGRMANPLFRNMTSDILWDEDYNPEGLSERYALKIGGARLFATAAQIVLDNQTEPAGRAQWMLAYQAGGEVQAGGAGINLAVLYYTLANGTKSSFSQVGIQDGNTRVPVPLPATPVVLANPFHVISATSSVSVNAGVPITVSADVVKNLADTVQTPTIEGEDLGFSVGLKLGNAGKAHSSELAYLYKSIETDATLADLNDSETGPRGGTNRKGHTLWAAYSLSDASQLKLRYMNTKVKNEDLPPAPLTVGSEPNPTHHRIQLDFTIRF